MKILIVSDAWLPQVNGVVRTLQMTCAELEKRGHTVKVVGPDLYRWACFSLPTYSEITLEAFARRRLTREIDAFAPDSLHIATEGPLGWTTRKLCRARGWAFTTAYHTRFPQYLASRVPRFLSFLVARVAYAFLRAFHRPSSAVLVPTESIRQDLIAHGFTHVSLWTRGVDTDLFVPGDKDFPAYRGLARPVLLCVSRVSVEKNIQDFLALRTAGTKVVVGSGPDEERLKAAFPEAVFLGRLQGKALARAYAAADLFVFPSRSDTFGLVLLEACAAGLRIAAHPVAGPQDVLSGPGTASFVVLDDDLDKAVQGALALPESPEAPRAYALQHSWAAATDQFMRALCPLTLKNDEK